MNRTSRQYLRARFALAGAACLAATTFHAASAAAQEYTWVLVRPAPRASDAELERARAEMGIKPADRLVATPSGAEIWRMPSKGAEALVKEGRTKEPRSAYTMVDSARGDPQAVVYPASESELTAQAKATLEKVKARGYAKRVGLVRTPPAGMLSVVLRYANTVTWQLFDKVQFKGTRHVKFSRLRNAERFSWVGGLDAKANDCDAALFANGFASVTFGNNHLYGRFEKGRDIYQIVPLGDGFHATIEVDPDKLPDQPDLAGIEDEGGDMLDLAGIEDEGGDMLDLAGIEDEGGDMLDRKGVLGRVPPTFSTCKVDIPGCNTGAKAARATMRIGVAFTRDALADLPLVALPGGNANATQAMSTLHYADYLVNITNAAFLRSGVNSRVELAGVHVFDRLENAYADSKLLLAALRTNPADAPVLPVHQWRNDKGADIVVVLARNATYPGVGAVAGLSPPPGTLGNASQAYSIVVTRSADAQLSFQHELGHVMGAGHNWAANTPASFSWAHGFRNKCEWRTIMSYEDRARCNNHGTPRYALLSSCNVVVNGNTLAGSNLENNTRVVNEQAGTISKYRP